MGLFAYYAKWIPEFSSKIQSLVNAKEFPLSTQAENAFNVVKKELEVASLNPINEAKPFVVECDASESTISATLNQAGRPVAFMSRTLQGSELHYPALEKVATAIIEVVRKGSYFLLRREFHLITDQRTVAFMLDKRKHTKIKNNKIQGWRLELASYGYTIQYRPGRENVGPDTLTRAICASMTNSLSKLSDIHDRLCHPGVTRLLHFVRTKNLPYSTDDVKILCHSCRICAELKPQFYLSQQNTLIKATQPMKRWSIDFKGPLRSSSQNTYMLTIVDEYSRFPFAFPCPNTTSATVMKCLDKMFVLCGTPSYIHSDRGSSIFVPGNKGLLLSKQALPQAKPLHITLLEMDNENVITVLSGRVYVWHGELRTCQILNGRSYFQMYYILSDRCFQQLRTQLPMKDSLDSSVAPLVDPPLPTWLSAPGNVMLRRFVRSSKNDPLVDEVELTGVNPAYAHIRYPDGRESYCVSKRLISVPISALPISGIQPTITIKCEHP